MSEGVGLWLRRTREARNLTLEDAVQSLRIKKRYLQALEVGDYAALPGEIQTRGFLRNYARFLGLSIEDVVARYEAEADGRPFQPRVPTSQEDNRARFEQRPTFAPPLPSESEPEKDTPGIPRGLLQLAFVAFIIFFLIFLGSLIGLQVIANLPEADLTVTPTPMETAVVPVVDETIAPQPTFRPAEDGKVVVRLAPQEHAWVSVSSDADIVFQGIAEPGQPIEASATEVLIVATGNGGAFQLYVNGDDWGRLGEQGVVVRRVWSPEGEISSEEP